MSNITTANVKAYTGRKKRLFDELSGWLFASPAILGFLIFILGPMIASLFLSMTDYTIVAKPNFIGFQNYVELFISSTSLFFQALKVTAYYVALSVPMQIIFSYSIALLLHQKVKCLSFFRTAFYLPTIVPLVASSMVWMWLLNPDLGFLNEILRALNLPTSQWIYAQETVIPTLALMSVWSSGGAMLIFLAALQDIPNVYYEAIYIDGGNSIDKLRYVTIPMTTPTIFFNLVMGLINGFQVFVQPYIMTEGGPKNSSLMYVFYLYREAFALQNMGNACAIAWILFIIIMAFTALIFKTSQNWVYYEGE
jgi:multiple sugar transport system permease protein